MIISAIFVESQDFLARNIRKSCITTTAYKAPATNTRVMVSRRAAGRLQNASITF